MTENGHSAQENWEKYWVHFAATATARSQSNVQCSVAAVYTTSFREQEREQNRYHKQVEIRKFHGFINSE